MQISRREFVQAGAAAQAVSALPSAPASRWQCHFRDDHDVDLPDWGPYTLRYIGISHVAARKRGVRFDLSVFPGYYRRKIVIPHARWESDFHPWEAAADLNYYAIRHQLEWKDRVYGDISYSRISDAARLIRCQCVNATARNQNLALHYMGYLNFPSPRGAVDLQAGAHWVSALDYRQLNFATPRPQDTLTYDGLLRGEVLAEGFTGGSGVGKFFGRDRGDTIIYDVDLPHEIADAVLVLRYRVAKGATARITFHRALTLAGTGGFQIEIIPCGTLRSGRHTFSIVSDGGAAIDIDGFAISPAATAAQMRFRPEQQDVVPQAIEPGARPNSLLLKYKALDHWYGIAWNHSPSQVRQFFCGELEPYFRDRVHNHVSLIQRGPGDGHFSNVFLRPIPLAPNSSAVLHGMVANGSRGDVERMLQSFPTSPEALERIYSTARARRVVLPDFSQRRLAADTLTNTVFPVYLRRHYIVHSGPGRWWPTLYSWDAGFTGLGLLELDVDRAIGLLNTYLTPPADPHAAFIHHGTPLPVQIYLFHEIWNRTRSRELLVHFYPRLRQYHMFLAGRLGSSTTRRLSSQLLQTWDYFYNTGWDDYPPQVYMHQHKLAKGLAAPTTTAHAIRTAKILAVMAEALGESKDTAIYREDIAIWAAALQRYSWDEESGYFGYVQHDGAGKPTGILRHEKGVNFNMGMCGAYPFFAGICAPAQEKRLVGHMMSDRHLWTRIGMTTVDQSAPYYQPDGYWNGAVWFPHQWFVWKSLLDLGYGVEAQRIAVTALDLWRNEVEDSYGCFEHFMVDSGRGAGWHHFTSLSAPALSWYASYNTPGRLTAGFDTSVEGCEFSTDHRSLDATLRMTGEPGRESLVLCVMNPSGTYRVSLDGSPAQFRVVSNGVLEIRVPNRVAVRRLAVMS